MKLIEVWVNCPDIESADRIAEALVAGRYAACANRFGEIHSRYHWDGKIESEPEIPLLLKSRMENFGSIVEKVKELHPYEVPSIVGIPVEFVNDEYLSWIYAETEQR